MGEQVMVGNIKKGMLAGSQMLTEPKVTWRQGIGEAIVGAVDKAAQAKQQFDEREKNLVWSRLDLEAANLQAEELESIRTAGSIDDVLAIKKDFESKIKANMDGQKWGKEWIEQKGSSYFTANQNDVAKAFRAKEKELLSIQLEKNLELYADAIARSDGEQAELLKQKALGEMGNLKGLLSPTEEHKTITNFDERIKAKKNDILSQQKRIEQQKKLEGQRVQAETWQKIILGEAGEEYIMKQMPSFYNPKEATAMLKYLKDDNTALTDKEKSFVGNAGNMSVEELYKEAETKGYSKKALDMAITKQSRIKKERDETEKDVAEVEKENTLLDAEAKAFAGLLNADQVDSMVFHNQLDKDKAEYLKSIIRRVGNYSDAWKNGIALIEKGEIKNKLALEQYVKLSGMSDSEAKDFSKMYDLYEGAKTSGIEKTYNELAFNAMNGWLDRESEEFKSLPYDKQKALIQAQNDYIAEKENIRYESVKKEILNNKIDSIEDLAKFMGNNSIHLSPDKFEQLNKLIISRKHDASGYFDKAVKYAKDMLPQGNSPAERQARDKVFDAILSEYTKAINDGKSLEEIAELMSPEKVIDFITKNKPTQNQIDDSIGDVFLSEEALKQKREGLFNVVKSDKSGGKEEVTVNSEATLDDIIDYDVYLNASKERGFIDGKLYDQEKNLVAKALNQKVLKIEEDKRATDNTVIGNIYSRIQKRFKMPGKDETALELPDKADLIRQIYAQMKYWGIPTDLKASGWQTWYAGDKKRLEQAIRGYNDGLPKEKQKSELDIHLIIDAALKQFAIDKGLAIDGSNVFFYGDLPISIDSVQDYNNKMAEQKYDIFKEFEKMQKQDEERKASQNRISSPIVATNQTPMNKIKYASPKGGASDDSVGKNFNKNDIYNASYL